jgi:D-alanine-D-alanine ligase
MRIAILTGGESSEREIALQSAANVGRVLSASFENVLVYDVPKDLEKFITERTSIDVVVPIFHGQGGEDGSIQGFLNTLKIPFIFSDVRAHALAMDKAMTKDVVSRAGVLTAPYRVIRPGMTTAFEKPCVIKPIDGGSSIGISLVKTQEDFARALAEAFKYSASILVEDFIPGKEFTVAVIEEEGNPVALPVIEIRSKNAFFDYESKYNGELAEELCPAPIDEDLRAHLQEIAIRVHETIGARHLTRSDFIVSGDGQIWFLEVNTIPGQTLNSLVPKAIRASGRTSEQVFRNWIESVSS